MPYARGLTPPALLQTETFLLRPIRAEDAAKDYEAVMESRAFLRDWEQSTWPEDDFTVEANRQDLIKLETRHAKGESFSYTVQTPDQTECLGCLYVFPQDASMFTRSQIKPTGAAIWQDIQAAVYFWIRKSRLPEKMDQEFVKAVIPWLQDTWGIETPVIVTNTAFAQQVGMLRAVGLTTAFRIEDPKAQHPFVAFAPF